MRGGWNGCSIEARGVLEMRASVMFSASFSPWLAASCPGHSLPQFPHLISGAVTLMLLRIKPMTCCKLFRCSGFEGKGVYRDGKAAACVAKLCGTSRLSPPCSQEVSSSPCSSDFSCLQWSSALPFADPLFPRRCPALRPLLWVGFCS